MKKDKNKEDEYSVGYYLIIRTLSYLSLPLQHFVQMLIVNLLTPSQTHFERLLVQICEDQTDVLLKKKNDSSKILKSLDNFSSSDCSQLFSNLTSSFLILKILQTETVTKIATYTYQKIQQFQNIQDEDLLKCFLSLTNLAGNNYRAREFLLNHQNEFAPSLIQILKERGLSEVSQNM